MEDFGSFGGFQGTNSGRTLGVFCQNLPLALGGRDCGRRIHIISFQFCSDQIGETYLEDLIDFFSFA